MEIRVSLVRKDSARFVENAEVTATNFVLILSSNRAMLQRSHLTFVMDAETDIDVKFNGIYMMLNMLKKNMKLCLAKAGRALPFLTKNSNV